MSRFGQRLVFRALGMVAATGGLAPAGMAAHAADPVADFYSGKTVQLVIGYAPGGGYDIYARSLARHMARHIPGNPTIVVQNMPGAGSIKAANYLYNIAPKDGTSFGGFSRGAFLDPLLGRAEGVQYVAAKYGWLGSISNEVGVCAFRADSGVATWQDMRTKSYVIGSTGAGADSDVFPIVLRKMFGLPMKVVTGYHSAADVVLAITRKEVDGRCGWSWSSLMAWNKDMYQSKAIKVALQLASQKLAELPDTPSIVEVAREGDQQAALKLILSRQMIARPYVAPPGIPPERLNALRAAFDATMKDPDFLAEAQRQDLEVRPLSGIEAAALINEIYASPPAVVKLAIEVMKE
ncbi:MAG TPA: tripartite tricarboxylate transporter substrate-binding protein [Xanthobacteraceae bacterium]|jgi:tripartite-type tricarboxylate transporter receptor subunit TctC